MRRHSPVSLCFAAFILGFSIDHTGISGVQAFSYTHSHFHRQHAAWATGRRRRERSFLPKPLRSEMMPIENMKAQEIKAELDLREISYVGCYDKSDLVNLLKEARATGKCDPSILTEFNRQVAERMTGETTQPSVKEADLDSFKAGDGSLPGGLSPEMMSKLASNPEVMSMLSNPKLQEIMKSVMEGGPDAAGDLMQDPETKELMQKMNAALTEASKN